MITQDNRRWVGYLLNEILLSRKASNPRYSLRAFARDLELSPGRLSNFITGSSNPGRKLTERILKNLMLPPSELDRLRERFEQDCKKGDEERSAFESEFAKLTSWEHHAILSLMNTSDFQDDVDWISKRLGLKPEVAAKALEDIKALNLVGIQSGLPAPLHVPSTHRQIFQRSVQAIEKIPHELHEIASLMVAINVENLPEARNLIREFRRKIASLLSRGRKTEVYTVCIGIIPITDVREP